MEFTSSFFQFERRSTREILIQNPWTQLKLGGDTPIVYQSMITSDTLDTEACVQQTLDLAQAGCQLVRITAQTVRHAANLEHIAKALRDQGCYVPLVADIHFKPEAAMEAAKWVEVVRVNPGNYADSKKFKIREYTDEQYREELERIESKFAPLVELCKKLKRVIRIGTNHGSLSDRILSRYGDTPLGMVESALEFLRICREEDFHNIILSMKASNTQVMVQAYRLLIQKMKEDGMNYPLHLGVTEAGEGEDGRIKSAVGIGTLLEDGIGDTVRVSLTEEPEYEIPVARDLVDRYQDRIKHEAIAEVEQNPIDSYNYQRRKSSSVLNIGDKHVPIVRADFSLKKNITPASFFALGYRYSVPTDKWNIGDMACDYVFLGSAEIDFDIPGTLGVIYHYDTWLKHKDKERVYPFLTSKNYLEGGVFSEQMNVVYACLEDLNTELMSRLKADPTAVLLIDTWNAHGMVEQRRLFMELMNADCQVPVIIGRAYGGLSEEKLQLQSATDMGALLLDGLGDGIFIAAENCGSDQNINQTAFGILQATRTRISKTEYISCPSCGRTLFDLQETTAKIRAKTNHLKGVKIGIMGCIVNGPGEMADADYGYVGTGVGKITLYKEREVVQRNIPEEQAVDALIDLIKSYGDWVEAKSD